MPVRQNRHMRTINLQESIYALSFTYFFDQNIAGFAESMGNANSKMYPWMFDPG
jgi:hypothetical protein